jgi:hypothetical protein
MLRPLHSNEIERICGEVERAISADRLDPVAQQTDERRVANDHALSPCRRTAIHWPAAKLLVSRGGPIRAGWNKTAAAIVHSRASAISLPMLDVPGWLDIHKLPNAIAVVMAL